ncbi:FG-GAP repeat domain-containing protein [Streptomyces lavendulae]|uniref:FG-GAP repeat domain-containing protein n=1 Tax=Streptomyces lavendulae TaxID=1914 RepID=UPI0037FFBD1D
MTVRTRFQPSRSPAVIKIIPRRTGGFHGNSACLDRPPWWSCGQGRRGLAEAGRGHGRRSRDAAPPWLQQTTDADPEQRRQRHPGRGGHGPHAAGDLDGSGGLGDRVRIGTGWNALSELAAPGDLNADGKPDLAAVGHDGTLWAHLGTGTLNGTATLGERTSLGTDGDTVRQPVGADFDNDGKGDLSAVQAPATNWCAPTARPGAHHGPRSRAADGHRRDELKRAAGVGGNVPDHPCADPAGFLRAT